MAHPAACLFDLDGLLLDTEPLHAQAWQQAAHHFGRPLADPELMQLRGRRRLDCAEQVREWIRASQLLVPSVDELLAIRQPIAEALLIKAQPMAGAQAMIRRCIDLGLPMALATSSSKEAVNLKAKPHPWLAAIEERVHGDDPELRRGKPHPDVFQLAAQRLGVNCKDSWAFEDSPAGARAALAAGCRVFVVPAADADPALYPDEITDRISSLNEVLTLLN